MEPTKAFYPVRAHHVVVRANIRAAMRRLNSSDNLWWLSPRANDLWLSMNSQYRLRMHRPRVFYLDEPVRINVSRHRRSKIDFCIRCGKIINTDEIWTTYKFRNRKVTHPKRLCEDPSWMSLLLMYNWAFAARARSYCRWFLASLRWCVNEDTVCWTRSRWNTELSLAIFHRIPDHYRSKNITELSIMHKTTK